MRYRKLPVEIEAVQFTPDTLSELAEFLGDVALQYNGAGQLLIDTLEGVMKARPGDFIIKGVAGEFYPCKPDIFEATYELVG